MLAKMERTNDGLWSTIPKMSGKRTPIHTAGETDRQATGTSRILLQTTEKNNLRLKFHPGFKGRAAVTGCRHHRQAPKVSRLNIFSLRSPWCSHRIIPRSNHTNTLRNGRYLTQRLLWVWVRTFRLSCWCEVCFSCNFVVTFFLFASRSISTLLSIMGCTCYTMFDLAPLTQPWGSLSSFCTRTNYPKIWPKIKRSFLRPFGMSFRRRKPYFKSSSQRSYQISSDKLGVYLCFLTSRKNAGNMFWLKRVAAF